jgi:hypothetical protein
MAIPTHFVVKSDGSVAVSNEPSRETKWSQLEADIYANIVDPDSAPERVCNFCTLMALLYFEKLKECRPDPFRKTEYEQYFRTGKRYAAKARECLKSIPRGDKNLDGGKFEFALNEMIAVMGESVRKAFAGNDGGLSDKITSQVRALLAEKEPEIRRRLQEIDAAGNEPFRKSFLTKLHRILIHHCYSNSIRGSAA